MSGAVGAPSVLDVVRASERLAPHLAPTPAVRGAAGSFLKLENLQATGAYKVRGALNALAAQVERGDDRPVVAASAGNHGLGVAWAARKLGLRATVVVPAGAPEVKVRGALRLGAEVVRAGDGFESALETAHELAGRRGLRFLHAFDDPDVIAGQGTVALELLHLSPDAVLVPVGGGGLAAGMGLVLRAHGIPLWGVQVESVDGLGRAIEGKGAVDPPHTIADGLRVARPGRLTTAMCAEVLAGVLRVTEAEVRSSILELAEANRIVAEGAGATAAAALDLVSGKRKIAVVTGGNIDLATLAGLVDAARGTGTESRVDR